jgi:hypothetical protein
MFDWGWGRITETAAWTILWALIGRAIAHARAVQMGHRRLMSINLIWEIPIAIGMARIGVAAADFVGMNTSSIRDSIVITVAYLGPRLLETIFAKASDMMKGKEL